MRSRWIRRIVLRLVLGGVGAVTVVFALSGAHGAPAQTDDTIFAR